ncbi:MAG: hypothetical protein FDZ70_08280 [Actinobacteria bacterium]|nr:MAG: hypothetical protein FDZ70_08280 [Actinomycetota bacterium]
MRRYHVLPRKNPPSWSAVPGQLLLIGYFSLLVLGLVAWGALPVSVGIAGLLGLRPAFYLGLVGGVGIVFGLSFSQRAMKAARSMSIPAVLASTLLVMANRLAIFIGGTAQAAAAGLAVGAILSVMWTLTRLLAEDVSALLAQPRPTHEVATPPPRHAPAEKSEVDFWERG